MANYRRDIDGLRALAVLPVVLFHAGAPGFGGGFVGVDIFFVISGFLLTGILTGELESGDFSLSGFYVRRARRILPALLVVTVATVLAAFYLSTPEQFALTGEAAQATVTITANLLFARTQANYWEQSSLAEQPLLHTWSLSVEEQFYVVLPLLLWALHAGALRSRRWAEAPHRLAAVGLLACALASLVCAQLWLLNGRASAFFLLPARAWELLAGSCLALVLHRRRVGGKAVEAGGLIGLALIAAAVFGFDEAMPFPGLAALVPCAGACLVILSGSAGSGPACRLLSIRPLVGIGLISYSLYLWHWPVLVFTRSIGWYARSAPQLSVPAQLILMFGLAWLSWRFVEQPFRRPSSGVRIGHVRVLSTAAAALSCVWGVGAVVHSIVESSWPVAQPVPELIRRFAADMHDTPGLRCEGSNDPVAIRREGGGCIVGAASGPLRVALMGDSHARMYTEAMHRLGQERGERVLVMARSSCVPALGFRSPSRPECDELSRAGLEFLAHSGVSRVVLAGYWVDLAPDDAHAAKLAASVEAAVAILTAAGKEVVLVLDVPELPDGAYPHRAALRSIRSGGAPVYGPALTEHRRRQAPIADRLAQIAHRRGASMLDPAQLLCSSAQGCVVASGERALYRDRHHLTDAAALDFRWMFAPAFSPERPLSVSDR